MVVMDRYYCTDRDTVDDRMSNGTSTDNVRGTVRVRGRYQVIRGQVPKPGRYQVLGSGV